MPSKRTSRSGTTGSAQLTDSNEFEKMFATIDGAVSGAILVGVHPAALEAEMHFWFFRMSSGRLPFPDQQLKAWMTDLNRSLVPTIDSIIQFAREYDGPLRDGGERDEFANLQQRCLTVEITDLPEMEMRRHGKQAEYVIEWIVHAMARHADASDIDVELAFLVEFVKLLALGGTIDPEAYFIVKQSVPAIWGQYKVGF